MKPKCKLYYIYMKILNQIFNKTAACIGKRLFSLLYRF